MKKLFSSFVVLLAAFASVAQNSFSYQSVIRDDGKVLENKSISLRLSIMLDDSVCYQEQHAVTTNAYGNVNVSVGEGEPLKGSFAAVPWESMRVMMRIEADVTGGANFTDLGSMQIMPVPYAMYAHRTTTVIQPAVASEEPIFEINDSNGNPMFAVYETGVKVFVDYDDDSKAAKSKFAVAGRPGRKGDDINLLTIDKDGTLVYVDDDENDNANASKAAKSKFAVAGRPGRKGDQQGNLLTVSSSGSTIYVDDNANTDKAAKSKFAVAGRPGRKGASDNKPYFVIDQNGALVYVGDNYDDNTNENENANENANTDESANTNANKAAKSKFAVAGRPGRKGGQPNNLLTIDENGSTIYVDNKENAGKAAKSKFAVAGRPGRKSADSKSENLFTIDGDGSTIYVDFNSSDKAAKSKFAVAGRPGRKDAADNVMTVDGDQATFYIDIDDTNENTDKAAKSKFAVAGRPGKGDAEPYFIIDQFGSVIYIDEADSKAAKSRFAVAGRSGKGGDNYFTINRDSTRIYINDAPVADTTTGEVVVPSLASGFAVVGMVQKSDLLAVSKDSTIIKIDTYVAEEVQSVSGEVSKIIDDSKADKSYSSGALYLPLVKSEGGMTTRKKFLINYTYYHSDNGEYLYLKTQFKSGSDLINTVRNYYIVDGQVYGDNTYYVKYIEAGEPTIMPYSEVNPDFKEKLKLNLKSDNDLLVILESTMRDSAYSALAEDGRTAFYSPNGDHGKVMESERNIVAMMNDSARSLFSGNLNVFYSLLDTAVRVTQTVGMSYLTSLQWNYGTVSDFYNIDLSDYYYTLYDGDITDENIKITENYQDFTMRGDYQRRNLTEIETMFAGLKEGFDINAQPNNAAWGSVEKPATKVNYGDSINLVPVAAEGCIFLGWNDGCTDSVRRIGITGPINYTANFQPATYYVSNKNSNDDFDGFSDQTPLASLSKALEKINGLGKADASFTINISGLFVNDTTVTIGACAAKSLTIVGTDKQTDGFKIKEAATNTNVLCVANSTTKVTLKNLKITGGSQYAGYASALYVGGENINANVQLDNVLITENGVRNVEGICPVGILVVEGSSLTIGSGTEIKGNDVGETGAAIVNSGTTVMKGGFIGDNYGYGHAPWDLYNYGEFTIDGDVEVGNVVVYYEYSSNTFKTITIGSHFDATADIVGTFGGLYGYYSNETQVLTLPDGLSDVQKKVICDKFVVEPETDYYNEPISYWKVGTSGKLEQVGHVVFKVEPQIEMQQPGVIIGDDIVIAEYNIDFGSVITKPADPDIDHMYLWYKVGENGPETTEYIFDENAIITTEEPYIEFKGIVVPTKCIVTFDTRIEGFEIDAQTVDYGGKATMPNTENYPDFKKDGYTFAGWYYEQYSKGRLIKTVNFDFTQPITADVTLFAMWVAHELYVDVANGNNDNSGIASNKALKTIQASIDTIKYWNVADMDYTITVLGMSGECVTINGGTGVDWPVNAKSITLKNYNNGEAGISGTTSNTTLLTVKTSAEVILDGFTIKPTANLGNYTSPSTYKKGMVLYVGPGADVTLKGNTVLDGELVGDRSNSRYNGAAYVENGALTMTGNAVIKNFGVMNGGGVYVYGSSSSARGSFTMEGNAKIENCKAGDSGGGVNVNLHADAVIKGNATITGNSAGSNGGGVYLYAPGSLTMEGGSIANNTLTGTGTVSGGGVYVDARYSSGGNSQSVFDMKGGTISGNKADNAQYVHGKGVYVNIHNSVLGKFKMSGSAKVDANNDVCLEMMSNKSIPQIIVAGDLSAEAPVATITPNTQNYLFDYSQLVLTTENGANIQNTKFDVTSPVTYSYTKNKIKYTDKYYLQINNGGYFENLKMVVFNKNYNGAINDTLPADRNGIITAPSEEPKQGEGTKVFTGWYTTSTCEAASLFNFDNALTSDTTTLYAGWGDPEVYVPSAPDGAAGAMTAASLAKAVELINSKDASDLDWTIKINGQLNGKQVISGTIAADTIILIGARDLDANGVLRDMLNGNFTEPTDSAVLNIFATNPVIIKNLKITGGNNSTDLWTGTKICGGGLHVASGANVSLADGAVIAGNKAYAGGGAYVKGIMYMYGSAVIGDANAAKAPVGESDCSNYASQYGGGVYVAGGSFYMGCNSCTMSVVNQQAVYEYNNVKLTGGVFGNRSNYDGGGVYSSGSYAKVYMNSGVIANNSALKNGGAVRNTTVSGFILSGDAYIPAGADFKHDVYLENGSANVTIDGTLTHEKVAQIMPTKTTTSTSLGYDNKYSDYGSLDDKNNQYGKFTITPFVISETAPNTITYYQYTYVNGQGIKATANGSAQNIPQFTQITLSDNVFGGDVVTATITGENFTNQMLNFTSICLNDTMVNATFTRESATEITATFPAPATAGTHTVKVQTYGAEPLIGELEVNGADPHTFYVKPGGDDTNNDGLTPNTAFASLGTALNKIKNGDGNTETEYTIKVMGTTLGNISITNDLNSKAGRITFEGATKPVQGKEPEDVITGSSSNPVLSIQTTVPITIKNLKITEGNSMLGGGIYVNAENADVTLDDGALITENSASNNGGGGVDIYQGKLTMLAGSKISGNHAISGGSGGGVAIYEHGTLDMKGGEISGNTTSMVGSGVYVQGTMIMSGGAVVAADNDVSLASGNTVTVGNLAEGENTVATITPQNYPSTTSQVQVLSGEYVATEYSRFAVTPQGNADNPSMPSEWEVNGEGNLIKISPVVVTLTHSNIQEFTPDEEKSYEFIFDNTVTDSDLEYFCYNYDINRSSTLDMSQATLIANVNSLPAYLITVVLPPNVESISSDAFANIAFRGEATSVTIADGNAHYKTIDGVLFGEKETWGTGISNLLFYPPAKSGSTYEIPSFVTRIEDCGFMYNKNLVTINGLERIVYLQTFVFVECQKLQSANLSGVTMSGYNLFRNCQALESVTWGKESMLWAVFADCPKLEQIHFTSATPPSYLGAYGDYPVEFYGCNPNLKFYVPAGSRNAYLSATGDNGFYSSANACYDGNTYGYSGSLADRIIEEGTSYIGSKAPGSQLAVGDIVFNDGSAEYYTNIAEEQKSAAIAVIFYKGTDCSNNGGERTLGVGLKQDASGLAWCVAGAEASSVDITSIKCEPSGSAGAYTFEASYDKNGSDNLKQIADFFGKDVTEIEADYPAFYWAKNYTTDTIVAGSEYATGWYFPSAAEFYSLSSQVTMVNAAMDACGGTKFETGKNYWTSSQSKAEVVNATGFVYNASVGFVATSFKKDGSNVLRICAIRDFSTGGGSTSQTTPDWMISDGQGHYYVDLGTNTLWATTNIGAENPQDFGDYFAWGETQPYYLSATGTWNDGKKGYYWKNYKYTDAGDTTKLTKYYSHTNYGDNPDNKKSLETGDDAAYYNWGSNWVMPTQDDWTKLLSDCYCPWVESYNETGVSGRIVYKAKNEDDKGKAAGGEATYDLSDPHIFFPAAGWYEGVDKKTNDSDYPNGPIGEYWYSENNDGSYANVLELKQSSIAPSMQARCYGLPVRPVIRNP